MVKIIFGFLILIIGIAGVGFGLLMLFAKISVWKWVVLCSLMLLFIGKKLIGNKQIHAEPYTRNYGGYHFPDTIEHYYKTYEYLDISYVKKATSPLTGTYRIMADHDKGQVFIIDEAEKTVGEIVENIKKMVLDYMERGDTVGVKVFDDTTVGLGFYKDKDKKKERTDSSHIAGVEGSIGSFDENGIFVHDSAKHIPPIEYADNLSGVEFEQYCAAILDRLGYYNIQNTATTGDRGADLITWKMNRKSLSNVSVGLRTLATRLFRKYIPGNVPMLRPRQ